MKEHNRTEQNRKKEKKRKEKPMLKFQQRIEFISLFEDVCDSVFKFCRIDTSKKKSLSLLAA
jgi:hypothetical protein